MVHDRVLRHTELTTDYSAHESRASATSNDEDGSGGAAQLDDGKMFAAVEVAHGELKLAPVHSRKASQIWDRWRHAVTRESRASSSAPTAATGGEVARPGK